MKTVLRQFFKIIVILPVLPLYILFDSFRASKKTWAKGGSRSRIWHIVTTLFLFIVFTPLWAGAYLATGIIIAENFRYLEEPIPIAGTGSMYPTFPKGTGRDPKKLGKQTVGTPGMLPYPNGIYFFGKRYFGHVIGRGDIAVFSNSKVQKETKKTYGSATGLVKRVIALPGDTLEIRDGLVYVNNQLLSEPYTARARSSFGGEFLSDCTKITIPQGKLFVMGDNRKASADSRHYVGLVDYKDLNHVLPLKSQLGRYDSKWRDVSNDKDESSAIKLDRQKYLQILNDKRKVAGVQLLRYLPKLQESARLRGSNMLKTNDLSFEATRSGYTMRRVFADVGYSNIVYGEIPTLGHFEAEELIENQFEFPASKEFLLDPDYQEIGIAEVNENINGCSTQIIVQHIAGYVPPNYEASTIDSWQKTLSSLREIQPSWIKLKEAKEYESFYSQNRDDVDRINEIFVIRIRSIEGVVARMKANEWLTSQELSYTNVGDDGLFNEQEEIAKRLNDR